MEKKRLILMLLLFVLMLLPNSTSEEKSFDDVKVIWLTAVMEKNGECVAYLHADLTEQATYEPWLQTYISPHHRVALDWQGYTEEAGSVWCVTQDLKTEFPDWESRVFSVDFWWLPGVDFPEGSYPGTSSK